MDPPSLLQVDLEHRYRIAAELGRGGMATVYLAQDLKHDRRVALKVLKPELALIFGRERFLREIRLTAQLQHPHILSVFDSGESAGFLWYTMPYAEGESLRSRLEREGQLPVDEALRIAREVADALSYAHRHSIVHRDIKPENILFSNGHAQVADFGIARAFDAASAERLTETGLGLGTPHYMSPEQSMGEVTVDGRSDQYALACVLYEMLAGEPPYDGPNAQSIIAKRLSQPAPSVRSLRETVPESVEHALAIALARSPADRFATTGEFVVAMTAPPPKTSGPVAVWRKSSWARRTAGSFGLAAIGGVLLWSVLRASPMIPPSASVIAVFPFAPATFDTALSRLGRDLAGTVSASLDGVGEIRAVDRLTIMAQIPEGAQALPLAQAAAMGRKLGATSVVQGSLSREGSSVRLDVGLYTTEDLAPLGLSTVLAPSDSLSALTDSVVWKLLADIWRRGTPPTPTLQAITTRSVPALRAYLDGERNLVNGLGEEAKAAFGRAIAADSTFWFAYFRFGNSLGWIGDGDAPPDSAAAAVYWAHRFRLPERERLLIEASRADSGLRKQKAILEDLVTRYPEYWPAWWVLGDNLFHYYPYIGSTRDDQRRALERVVELNPSLVYGWSHLADVYASQRDTSGLKHALDNLQRLGAAPRFIANEHLDMPLLLRAALASIRGGPPAGIMLDSLHQSVSRPGSLLFLPLLAFMAHGAGARQIELNDRLVRGHRLPPDEGRLPYYLTSQAWAMRGAFDTALALRDRVQAGPNDSAWVLESYRMAVLGAWLGALPGSEAERRRADAVRLAEPRGPGYRAEIVWLDGVRAITEHDLESLAAARAALPATGGKWAANLDQSLRAFAIAQQGNVRQAADLMAELEWRLGDTSPFIDSRTPHGLLRAIDRLSAARWLLQSGDTVQAGRMLTWFEAASGPFTEKFALAPHCYLLRARIAQAAGKPGEARHNYEQFLVRYDLPPVAHRAWITEARTALDRLTPRGTP